MNVRLKVTRLATVVEAVPTKDTTRGDEKRVNCSVCIFWVFPFLIGTAGFVLYSGEAKKACYVEPGPLALTVHVT